MVTILHHIFTHDLRWDDNRALLEGFKRTKGTCKRIQGWICLDPDQLDTNRPYTGIPGIITFLMSCQSLLEHKERALGNLRVFHGSVQSLADTLHAKSESIIVSCAKQFTPFAQERQSYLQSIFGDRFVCVDDHSLLSPQRLSELKPGTSQYLVFSPFYKLAQTISSEWKPIKYDSEGLQQLANQTHKTYGVNSVKSLLSKMKKKWKSTDTSRVIMRTTRTLGLQKLKILKKKWKQDTYGNCRNDINWTTSQLARFLNSGVISIREVWDSLGRSMPAFERQLVFRSFYDCRMNATFNMQTFTTQEFKLGFRWLDKDEHRWKAWITGTTGVPIVDAAMRCLKVTGWMHNRLRMVVASYLTRILLIDWREGEAWFAKHLFDYNATQNHFGWKGQAALSRDSGEYWRVMNPYTQAKKYDPECIFIRKWIPELSDVSSQDILNWEEKCHEHADQVEYRCPIIPDQTKARAESIAKWKQNTIIHSK